MAPNENSLAALKAEIARLQSENAMLSKVQAARITLKVSSKNALSLYGLGRWPVTLYKGQWLKVLGMADQIKAFMAQHPELAEKAGNGEA